MQPRFLYSVEALRRAEQAAMERLPAGTLMQRAGAAAARSVREMLGESGAPVLIVCGPGNNGGDGYTTAAALRNAGIDVVCVALAQPNSADAHNAAERWKRAGGSTVTKLPVEPRFGVIVDAMFGIGLARPLAGIFLDAVHWIHAQDAKIVAIDVPSGLDADCGVWVGGVPGIAADHTVTFIGAKPGLYTADGVDAAGHVEIDSIGVELEPSDARLNSPLQFAALTRPRPRNAHKGRFGDVVIVGGGAGMVGAALLAARAALRLGAGRVYVDCLGADVTFDLLQPELMFRAQSEVPDQTVRVIGCGLGTDVPAHAALDAALRSIAPLVIDADGLNLIAADSDLQRQTAGRSAATIVTPHPLEAARLLGRSAHEVQADRVHSARELAARLHAWVILKGAGSVVAAPQGAYAINPTGSAALSGPGTGDVLAGMIGSLLAQSGDVETAVHAAAWLHGAAADRHGFDVGLTAGEVAQGAARILGELRAR